MVGNHKFFYAGYLTNNKAKATLKFDDFRI